MPSTEKKRDDRSSRHQRLLVEMEKSRNRERCLVLDVSYLAYRSYFAMGTLSYGGIATTVAFGIFQTLQHLIEHFQTETIAFCFDVGKPLRKELYPKYKESRNVSKTDAERKARAEVAKQIEAFRTKYLPSAGFENIFWAEGYEADDVIASVCDYRRDNQDIIIVSADNDLYQLLGEHVILWNPSSKKAVTLESFQREYGIYPTGWADVKAIAGCKSDNIEGIWKVGEKTAADYLAGRLKPHTARYFAITSAVSIWERNIQLTRLPFPKVPKFIIQENPIYRPRLKRVLEKLGIESLEF